MTMKKYRKLKVYTRYQSRRYGEVQIPEIRLEGKWLGELGFRQGQIVKIKQEQDKLTITIDNRWEN